MNEIDLSGLDPEQRERWRGRLEHLPPGIRDSLRKNLARVPADKVARILRDNEPMISKLEAKLGGAAQQASDFKARAPKMLKPPVDKGHYNTTVQPGDAQGFPWLALLALAVGIVFVVARGMG